MAVGTCHPETKHTYELLRKKYWWDKMIQDINHFVSSCSLCALAKAPQHFLEGKYLSPHLIVPGHT